MGSACTNMKEENMFLPARSSSVGPSPGEPAKEDHITANGSIILPSLPEGITRDVSINHKSLAPPERVVVRSVNNFEDKLSKTDGRFTLGKMTSRDESEYMNDGHLDKSHNEKQQHQVYDVKRGDSLGKGPVGSVYKGLGQVTGQIFAVKAIKMKGSEETIMAKYQAIVPIVEKLGQISHRNLARYHHANLNLEESCLEIVSEFVPGGPITDLPKKFAKFDEFLISNQVNQILEGLKCLQDNGIIHRALKGNNILISADGDVKLCDYGQTEIMNILEDCLLESPHERSIPYWTAPEILMKNEVLMASDIWSLGCVTIELITLSPPWSNIAKSYKDLLQFMTVSTKPTIPTSITYVLQDFLSKTLQYEPEKRPTIDELFDHQFVLGNLPMNRVDSDMESVYSRQFSSAFRSHNVLEHLHTTNNPSKFAPISKKDSKMDFPLQKRDSEMMGIQKKDSEYFGITKKDSRMSDLGLGSINVNMKMSGHNMGPKQSPTYYMGTKPQLPQDRIEEEDLENEPNGVNLIVPDHSSSKYNPSGSFQNEILDPPSQQRSLDNSNDNIKRRNQDAKHENGHNVSGGHTEGEPLSKVDQNGQETNPGTINNPADAPPMGDEERRKLIAERQRQLELQMMREVELNMRNQADDDEDS